MTIARHALTTCEKYGSTNTSVPAAAAIIKLITSHCFTFSFGNCIDWPRRIQVRTPVNTTNHMNVGTALIIESMKESWVLASSQWKINESATTNRHIPNDSSKNLP